jgi:glycerophosphoryl diester phosphodiesterase
MRFLLLSVLSGLMGAEYVELDVMLSKDRVPVVFHDFEVSRTLIHPVVWHSCLRLCADRCEQQSL